MRRAVFYLRLSASADDSTSIAAQERVLGELAAREEWAIVRVLADDGLSGRKSRANADEALRMIREGEADVLAVYKLDRLSRQGLGALAALIDALDSRPDSLFVAHLDGLRSDQAAWRLIAGVLAEVARMEAENAASRMRTAVEYRHNIGRHTGGPPPLGYRTVDAPDGAGKVLEPLPSEAALVRSLAARLLAGSGVARLARELNRERVPTSRSAYRLSVLAGAPDEELDRGHWDATTVRRLLTSDRALGRVTHKGRLVTDSDGLPVTHYPPILEPATVELIRRRVAENPSRPVLRRDARLLHGIAYCLACDGRLYSQGVRGREVYRCVGRACSAPVNIGALPLEAHVAQAFLSVAGNSPELVEVESVTGAGNSSDLADIEHALQEAASDLVRDDLEPADTLARIAALKARRAELRLTPATVSVEYLPTGRTLAQAWHEAEELEERRNTLLRGLDHLTVARAAQSGRRFDAERVAFLWRAPATL